MSDDPAPAACAPVRLHAWWFVGGLLLGLAALSGAGWSSGRTDYHPGFARFYPAISPEMSYYPTLNEMTAIVRARCRPGQVLVIVGGNSILQGVWQPRDDLWSQHLQELLGDHYCVVNFALRGAMPTDGGAVVAEVLRREFPHQIYLANEAPFTSQDPIGHDPYRYIFWQAYFRGLLVDTPDRREATAKLLWNPDARRPLVEEFIQVRLDAILHFNDFWNQQAFERVNTVPFSLADYFPKLLAPRRDYPDAEPDAYDPAFRATRYAPANLDAEMHIVRNVTGLFYVRTPQGEWKMPRFHRRDLADNYRGAFPAALAPRTLILVSRSSPFYRRQLSPAELVREDLGFHDAVELWRASGYDALEYGRDFSDDDFGDRTHLSKSGGRKLAEAVAPEVRALADRLAYPR